MQMLSCCLPACLRLFWWLPCCAGIELEVKTGTIRMVSLGPEGRTGTTRSIFQELRLEMEPPLSLSALENL